MRGDEGSPCGGSERDAERGRGSGTSGDASEAIACRSHLNGGYSGVCEGCAGRWNRTSTLSHDFSTFELQRTDHVERFHPIRKRSDRIAYVVVQTHRRASQTFLEKDIEYIYLAYVYTDRYVGYNFFKAQPDQHLQCSLRSNTEPLHHLSPFLIISHKFSYPPAAN